MAMLFCRANVAPRVTLDTFLAQVLAQIASVRERTRWYGRCLERRLRSPVSPRNGRSERRNPLPEQGVSLRADDRIRTGDPHLGKVMLYQLSHVRVGWSP